ncbi:MAG: FAD-dependent thymidylate synthase [Akkermansia sp.]|nr:FAD-dependent thymidylate synthase [Akkermansia sp.]
MKIVQPNVQFIPMPTDKASLLKHIERCGRVCYKSEDKIEEGSAEKFIAGIIKRGHEAVLEHGAIILQIGFGTWIQIQDAISTIEAEGDFVSYLRFTNDYARHIVSGNVRAWRDFLKAYGAEFDHIPRCVKPMIESYPELFPEFVNGGYDGVGLAKNTVELHADDLITKNEKLHHQYQTLLFTCDRGVSHELVRHRPSSFCQESTRYCNYGKDGFGNQITVIQPCYLVPDSSGQNLWEHACKVSEKVYFDMLDRGFTPQEARAVLPNSLKTELMMTAHLGEWRHVISLRCSLAAHPQAREVSAIALGTMHRHIPEIFEDQWEEFCDD